MRPVLQQQPLGLGRWPTNDHLQQKILIASPLVLAALRQRLIENALQCVAPDMANELPPVGLVLALPQFLNQGRNHLGVTQDEACPQGFGYQSIRCGDRRQLREVCTIRNCAPQP